jgi:hypothetical protein
MTIREYVLSLDDFSSPTITTSISRKQLNLNFDKSKTSIYDQR